MSQKTPYSKALVAVLGLLIFATACTKAREAELPYEMQKTVFAISEFGDTQTENSQFNLKTESSPSELSLGNSSKATAEKGIVALDDVNVPARLKYMFSGLEITGLTAHTYPVTFSVDKQYVTVYKIVNNPSELTILEKQLAQVKDEVVLQKQLQKNRDKAKAKALLVSLQKAREGKVSLLSQPSATLLVPLFKYKIAKFGVLEKTKNDLKEDTSKLGLTETDWSDATHIVLSTTKEGRLPVGLDPAQAGDLDRTFVMDKINNKIMSAGTLMNEYEIPVNLPQDARVLTLLDTKSLHVFEVTQIGKADLTDSQRRQLQTNANGNVRACPADVIKVLPADAQKDCILILRYDVDVNYVRPELPVVDYDGNQDNKVNFKPVLAGQNIGLVQIPKDAEPRKVESNNLLDPNTTIRISDIKDKEFFFKRTLEEASYAASSPGLAPGMAGAITIVKFELEENRVVLRNADKLVSYKTTNTDADYDEIMSLPVKYMKLESKDSSGTDYSMPKLVPATRTDAQYIEVDWTQNSIPQGMSPYAAVYEGCIQGVANTQVAEMDMRLTSGVLNFSQKYSLALRPECIADYSTANGYNGGAGYQYTARVSERISLKLNDHSTDTSFVKDVPFKAQNAMGYGVWTTAQVAPSANGQFGREGTEINHVMVHDFRNKKVLKYTITGMPTDDPEMRKIYVGVIEELVKAWNFAYKQAFKGTALDRGDDPYITYEIVGENGVTGHLGDLDKNIFHFENKFADHGVLGVSQVGFNPRSAIVVADSLILYAGNVKAYVNRDHEEMNLRAKWEAMKESFRKQARENLAKEEAADAQAANGSKASAPASGDQKVEIAKAMTRSLMKAAKGPSANAKAIATIKNLGLSANAIRAAVAERKSLGGSGSFAYSSPRDQSAWMDKVLRAILAAPGMTPSEIQGVMAKEYLAAKGNSVSEADRASLNNIIKLSQMQAKLKESLKGRVGCLMTAAENANANFANMPFTDAFKLEAMNTMVHEMGHSQGLTHNFIGSYDKANYANEDGTPSNRNYSSVMDYITPGKFTWGGVGTYDIHAIRASHLGLLEVTPEFKAQLSADAAKKLVQDKYIPIDEIEKSYAKNGWSSFSPSMIRGVLKPYKYCTDIDVGWDPMCQRHDFGSTVTEVVESIANDWEDNYISSYHGWDRLDYSLGNAFRGPARSAYSLTRMRVFMDETFYKLVTRDTTQDEIQDYVQASVKAYLFYIQLITTPDTTAPFESAERFVAVPYMKKELDANGQPTGKETKDVAIVEKRAVQTFTNGNKDRVDTVGLEMDKVAAMSMLSLKGYPNYKYSSQNIEFSFLDFEKYILGMDTPNSLYVNLMTGMMLDKLQPTFTNADVRLEPVPNAKATVTASMRAYAGIYSILSLEASTLRDKDNFANLFKVASSVGKGPTDRLVLTQLGTSDQSKARVGFWALDNAIASQAILKYAGQKDFFIQNNKDIQPLMEKLIAAQFQVVAARSSQDKTVGVKAAEEAAKAKKALIAKLNALNKKGDIVSAATVQANPQMSIDGQVTAIMGLNEEFLQITMGLLANDDQIVSRAPELTAQAAQLADTLPLVALDQKAFISAMTAIGNEIAKNPGQESFADLGQAAGQILNGDSLETTYGLIMKNVEFLNMLTNMTNPEYAR